MATKFWISTSSTSFNTAANWSDAAAPVNNDTLVFNALGTANVETNLSTVLTGITIIKEKSYVGQIGVLTATAQTYLVLDGGTAYLENTTGGDGSGSPLLMLNFGTTAATVFTYDSASTATNSNYPPIILKGTVLTVHQSGGIVGVGVLPGEAATGTFRLVNGQSAIRPELFLGSNVTTTALTANFGTVRSRVNNTVTAATLDGDQTQYIYDGTGAHTTLTVGEGSTAIYAGTGTITTLNLTGTFDRTRDGRALTITTTNLYDNAAFLLDNGVSASTTRSTVNLIQCGMQDISVSTPSGEKL